MAYACTPRLHQMFMYKTDIQYAYAHTYKRQVPPQSSCVKKKAVNHVHKAFCFHVTITFLGLVKVKKSPQHAQRKAQDKLLEL